MKVHKASINVESNQKTIFTIRLDAIENTIEEEIASFNWPINTKPNVLFIVDDNKQICEYLKKVFKADTCYIYSNGLQALQEIPIHKPSCIISDYMMPNMNGLELIQNIREEGYKIPTIILTGNTDDKTKMSVLRLSLIHI